MIEKFSKNQSFFPILLGLVLILALFLRFFSLSSNPPSLSWDEVSHGYNAYSILKTGRDEWGELLPLANFRAYGDYPLPLYMYLSMPFISVFGLNELAIRFPSGLFGSLLVLVIFFLFKRVFNNSWLALLVAFLLAISPWSIFTSRQVLQSTPAVFLLSLGVLLFLHGVKGKRSWLWWGTISLGLSAYAYHNTRILAPVFLLSLIWFFWDILKQNRTYLYGILIIGGVFFLPLIPILSSSEGRARSEWVGILDTGAINYLNEARNNSQLPTPLNRLVYNKPVYFTYKAIQNYLGHFSPQFLALDGGTNYQFSLPNFGVIYPLELIFFYLGLAILILKFFKLEKDQKLLLFWVLLGPIPAAITRDPYQVVRSMVMMPAVYMIEGFGLLSFLKIINSHLKYQVFLKPFVGMYILVLGIFLIFYYYSLINMYPKQFSFAWQYGYKQAVNYITENQANYSKVLITKKYGEPHEFFLFYSQYDPEKLMTDPNLIRYQAYNWYWVDRIDKYEFVNDEDMVKKAQGQKEILLVTSPGNYPPSSKKLETINFLDGKPSFDIVSR